MSVTIESASIIATIDGSDADQTELLRLLRYSRVR
jgi:hypothetical protein